MRTSCAVLLAVTLCIWLSGCSRRNTGEATSASADVTGGETPIAVKRRGTFTVGKTTTYLTAPLDANGHIDYASVLNERLSKGVTPENNAAVLLWQAIGPNPAGGKMPAGYFDRLGVATPRQGVYFVRLGTHLVAQPQLDPAQAETLSGRLNDLRQHPWTAEQQPELRVWLKANEKPLAVVVEASKRPRYYSPLIPNRGEQGQKGLFGATLPGNETCRAMASALLVRAMLSTGEGNVAAAWRDLLACHRLGRLIGSGGTLIDGLLAAGIDQVASAADLAFLDHTRPDAKQLAAYVRDLQSLPPLPDVADQLDLSERFTILDAVMMVDAYGFASFESKPDAVATIVTEAMLNGIDWDPVLSDLNKWFDRLVANTRTKDRAERAREYEVLFRELKSMRQGGEERAKQIKSDIADGVPEATAKGRAVAKILVPLLLPAADKVGKAADRARQTFDNVLTAFALARYRREEGRYPDRLDALAPKYLPAAPTDLFSGKAPVYRPGRDGYLLYSLGVNTRDDGGHGPEDEPAGDDIAIRMPLRTPE